MEAVAKAVLLLLLGIPGIAALVAVALVWRGYVLAILWGWFMVPGFGFAVLSIPYAIGVSLIAGMLTNHRSGDETKDPDKKWTAVCMAVIGPALALLIGWVTKQYI